MAVESASGSMVRPTKPENMPVAPMTPRFMWERKLT